MINWHLSRDFGLLIVLKLVLIILFATAIRWRNVQNAGLYHIYKWPHICCLRGLCNIRSFLCGAPEWLSAKKSGRDLLGFSVEQRHWPSGSKRTPSVVSRGEKLAWVPIEVCPNSDEARAYLDWRYIFFATSTLTVNKSKPEALCFRRIFCLGLAIIVMLVFLWFF